MAKERAGLAKVSSAHGLLPHIRKSKGWVTSFSHLSLFPNGHQSHPLLLFVIKLCVPEKHAEECCSHNRSILVMFTALPSTHD